VRRPPRSGNEAFWKLSNRVNEFFEIGRIVKTHGLRGGVKVNSYLTDPGGLLPRLEAVYLQREEEEMKRYRLTGCQLGSDFFFLELEGIGNPEAASSLLGRRVFAPVDKLAALPEGEYYWHELIGMDVVTEEGISLGIIGDIFSVRGNDVYVCKNGGEERLLPASEEVVRKVDKVNNIMTVRLLEGL
jgi:16S rRNA processing protein RimM